MADEEGTDWIAISFKLVALLIVTFLPMVGVSWFLAAVRIVHPEWMGSAVLTCGLVFFVGGLVLILGKRPREWIYTLIIGFLVAVGCVVLTLISFLAYIPIPLVGNALNLVLGIGPMLFMFFVFLWPTRRGTDSSGLIATSSNAPSILDLSVFKRKPTSYRAMELVEVPHEFAFDEDKLKHHDILNSFFHVVRHVSESLVPFGLRFERRGTNTRVFLLTWSDDELSLDAQFSIIDDALRANLPKFKFKAIDQFSGLSLGPEEKGAAASVTGVPLAISDDNQNKTPLDGVAGVLNNIDQSVLQISVEPRESKTATIKSLESDYRREIEASETTISREKKGIFSGPQQESHVIVDAEAKRRAASIQRKIERFSRPILCETTVTAISWDHKIEAADLKARRIGTTLVGSLRPDNVEDGFRIKFITKQKDITKMLRGHPVGERSVLTPDEAACYFVLPATDLGIQTRRRGKFSSGTRDVEEQKPPEPKTEWRMFRSLVPTKVQLQQRGLGVFIGSPLDESGRPNKDAFLLTDVQRLDRHIAIFGNTRSGKTTTAISIIVQAIALNVNPIILVPSKTYDWRILLDVFPNVRVFTCGKNEVAPFIFNFWSPPPGTPLSKWVDRVVQVMTLWLPNDRVLSMHVEDVVYKTYALCGWNIETNTKGRPILLQDLVAAANAVIASLGYGEEVLANFRGALLARIKSLLRKPSLVKMFNTREGISIPELLANPTIIEMENLSDADKILLMAIITAAISEYKIANPSIKLENLLVLEEAHYLLGGKNLLGESSSGARAQAISSFVELLRVLGGNGLGVVLIDQLPSSLVPEAIKLPVNVIIHALNNAEDRRLVGEHTRCTQEQIDHIGGMKTGEAVAYLQKFREPKNIQAFSLNRIVVGGFKRRRITDEEVFENMQPLFESHPQFFASDPLPSGIMIELENSKTIDHRSSREELESHVQNRLDSALATEEFQQFCRRCISNAEEVELRKLRSVIKTIAERAGDGTDLSYQYLLAHIMRTYSSHETEKTIENLVILMQEETMT